MSVSKRSVSTLPSGFLAVPFPCTSATPTTPLKSVIDDGSIPRPKEVRWNVTPLIVTALVVGLGARLECAAADPAAGQSSPLTSEAPVAVAAAPPIKARREGMCRAWCDDDSELDVSGHPPLSAPGNCILPPHPERISA